MPPRPIMRSSCNANSARVLGGGCVGTRPGGGSGPVSLVAVEWAPAPVVAVALVSLVAVDWAPAPVVVVTLVSLVVVDPY